MNSESPSQQWTWKNMLFYRDGHYASLSEVLDALNRAPDAERLKTYLSRLESHTCMGNAKVWRCDQVLDAIEAAIPHPPVSASPATAEEQPTPMPLFQCTCGCHNKGAHAYHFESCPMRNHPDSVKARLKVVTESRDQCSKSLSFWSKHAQFWEGKYRIVKHENNKLRRKLYPSKMPRVDISTLASSPTPPPEPERKERCNRCGNLVADWVDPDWAHGRICRKCEALYEPKEEAPETPDVTLVRAKAAEARLIETQHKLRETARDRDRLAAAVQSIHNKTYPFADGAVDASQHDKLCAAVSDITREFVKP